MTDAFQSTINVELGFGIVGEVYDNGPRRGNNYELNSASAANNVIGRAFTVLTSDTGDGKQAGTAGAGGTGAFAGILANPKSYASFGTSADTLAPSLVLPNTTLAEFLTMADIIISVPAACAIGDTVYYDNTTGVLGTMPSTAVGEMSQSTTTVTVETAPVPTGNIGIGTRLRPASGNAVTVVALGTGTGQDGTYIVDVSQTVAANTAFTGNSVAPSGKTLVPTGKIVRFSETGAGLAVMSLTN